MNSVSSKQVINEAIFKFALTNVSVDDCIEWVGQAIEQIGYHVGFINKYDVVEIENCTIVKPIGFNSLNYFIYKGRKLNYRTQLSGTDIDIAFPELRKLGELLQLESDIVDEKIHNQTIDEFKKLANVLNYSDQYFYTEIVDANCWKTNAEGEVIMFYKALPLDEKGYPLVDNHISYRETIHWYILLSMMMRGYKHAVFAFGDVETRYKQAKHKASNYGIALSRKQKMAFVDMWTNTASLRKDFYEN